MTTTCIANSDTAKGPEVPLWECPCRECWALEMALIDPYDLDSGTRETYADWREARLDSPVKVG